MIRRAIPFMQKLNRRDFVRNAVVGTALAGLTDATALAQAGSSSQAPVDLRRMELLLAGCRARVTDARHRTQRHAFVCRVCNPRAGPVSVSGRARAWRRGPGAGLDDDAGRAPRLGGLSPSTRLYGVRPRPARAGAARLHPYLHGNFPQQAPAAENIARAIASPVGAVPSGRARAMRAIRR